MLKYFFKSMEGKLLADRYRLISLLGEGGIGFVARAEQVSVGREVAIKFLSRSAHDADQVARFKREAKALASLKHPACLTLHDFDYSAELECYYMVTELVDGVEFGDAIDRGMPLSDALLIMSHVCDALADAHAQGVLHRDLKPQNIMVTTSHASPVKLLDFGLARLYQSTFGEEDHKISRTGHVYGTPAYMSPEQCMADPNIGPATDIYSVGVMLYELCSGRLPFEQSTMTQVLLSHIREEAEPLDEPGVPAQLQDLIHAMLRKDPEERPSDLYEVRALLEEVAHELSGGRPRAITKTPLPELRAVSASASFDALEPATFRTAPANHPTLASPPSEVSEAEEDAAPPDLSEVAAPEPDRGGMSRGVVIGSMVAAALALIVTGAVATATGSQGSDPQTLGQKIELEPVARSQAVFVEVATRTPAVARGERSGAVKRSPPRRVGREELPVSTLPTSTREDEVPPSPEPAPTPTKVGGKASPEATPPAAKASPDAVEDASKTKRAKTLSFN